MSDPVPCEERVAEVRVNGLEAEFYDGGSVELYELGAGPGEEVTLPSTIHKRFRLSEREDEGHVFVGNFEWGRPNIRVSQQEETSCPN